jgi:hypothetical protein
LVAHTLSFSLFAFERGTFAGVTEKADEFRKFARWLDRNNWIFHACSQLQERALASNTKLSAHAL